MNKIEVRVVSNVDNLRCRSWPTYLCCRPMVGDYIMEPNGYHSGKIIRITHTFVGMDQRPALELYITD